MTRRKHPHTDLVKSVLDELLWRGVYVEPNNTGAMKTDKRFIRFGVPGAADLNAAGVGGRWVHIEIKTGSGRLSPAQKAYKEKVEAAGCLYIVIRKIEDLKQWSKCLKPGGWE